MKPLCLCSCAIVFVFYAVSLSTALKCDANKLPLVSGKCIEFVTTQPAPNLDAHIECQNNGGIGLLTLIDYEELEHLQHYIAVLGEEGVDYWLGYNFTDPEYHHVRSRNGDIFNVCSTPVEGGDNFGSQEPLPSGLEVCLTFRKDGMFYRRQCNESLPYICLQRVEAPVILSPTLSTSRFITATDPVTLTCMHSNGVTTTWRRDGVKIEPSTGLTIATPSENVTTLTIDTSGDFVGQYECVVANNFGAVVSEVVELLNSAGSDMQVPEVSSLIAVSEVALPQFGSQLNLTCAFNANSNITAVQWLINGVYVNPNNPNFNIFMESTFSLLVVEALVEEGVYQCRVFNNNGENSVATEVIDARPGKPSPVDTVIALPDTKSSVVIQWLPPLAINTYHPLLLRYNLHYQVNGESNVTSVSGLLPISTDGSQSASGLSEFTLGNVSAGTAYVLMLSAESTTDIPSDLVTEAVVLTYGNPPEDTVKQLSVSRTLDNKTIVVFWEPLVTTPPAGRVERYEVQYRNLGKELINTLRVNAQFNYFVIAPVEDANEYEVRVRAGVRVSRDPVEFEYNDFTAWEPVKGIATKVPPAPPTEGLGDRPGEIVAIVVSVVCVLALIGLVLVAGIICLVVRKRERPHSQRLKTESESESDTKAVNMSALQDDDNMIVELDKQPF